MFWPDLPETVPAEPADPDDAVTGDGWELRQVTPQDAPAVEASVPAEDREDTFAFFTTLPFPVEEFIADPTRRMYALWSGDRVMASTTVYNGDPENGTVMLGYTWVSPVHRGGGSGHPGHRGRSGRSGVVNTALKQAMYAACRDAGVREVWFRADVENLRSCRSMEKNGAHRMHLEDAPRVYPDGHVSQSVFYRKVL